MKYFFLLIILLSISCQEGLEVPEYIPPSKLSGTITYKGGVDSWPDSVSAIRVACFKSANPENFLEEILSENVFFSNPTLPIYVDFTQWELEITEVHVELKYIVVAMQIGNDLFNQKVIAVYSISSENTPLTLFIEKGESFNNINFEVDFDNLPPQPFDN